MAHEGARKFTGLKITQDRGVPGLYPDVRRVTVQAGCNELLFERFGVIGWGGNGGFHALNLAIQFGASYIVGVGFDMSLEHGVHWHGRHGAGLNNPRQASVDKWRQNFDAQRRILDMLGVEFVLGSPDSRLTAFRKLSFEEALNGNPQNRDK